MSTYLFSQWFVAVTRYTEQNNGKYIFNKGVFGGYNKPHRCL
ncbi:hypothetical protein [Sphaerospermopsis aphanizomenoides]|nr:hypothetical protein [Sphaerospermopsis aphanizomenoides]